MAKMGRPPKPIDWKIFEQLCHIQCTQAEIASFLHINVDTLHDRVKKEYNETYSETYKKFSEGGKCSLRRFQWKQAEKNATMAIWLGKQYLGQKDQEQHINNNFYFNEIDPTECSSNKHSPQLPVPKLSE